MFYINPGELRHKITIQENKSDGTTADDWEPLFSFTHDGVTTHEIYAAKKGLTGRLFYQAAAAQSENDVMFIIRHKDGITPQMRIVDGDKTYEIIAEPIDPNDQNQWLELHARRIDTNGS